MKFETPEIPEGINVTKVHPLRELVVLLGGALLLIVALLYVLGSSAGFLARYIPFDTELQMASSFPAQKSGDGKIDSYLESVKARLLDVMELPEGMNITLRYSADETVNAFATLGGNIVVYRGLLEKLPNENALSMLLAHEIAHVKHRDPIVSLSRGLTISATLTLLLGQSDLGVLNNSGLYTMLHFSREMEREADSEALNAVHAIYGHVRGADDLFKVIKSYRQESGNKEGLKFLQSHPFDQERINTIKARAAENHWNETGKPTAIPRDFIDALKKSAQSGKSAS